MLSYLVNKLYTAGLEYNWCSFSVGRRTQWNEYWWTKWNGRTQWNEFGGRNGTGGHTGTSIGGQNGTGGHNGTAIGGQNGTGGHNGTSIGGQNGTADITEPADIMGRNNLSLQSRKKEKIFRFKSESWLNKHIYLFILI